jgi:predicted HTH domain antitoxin
MQITVQLPDDLTDHGNPGREALEALVIEGYSSGALSAKQARLLLGFETRFELDDFLYAHRVEAGSFGLEQFQQDLAAIRKMDEDEREKRSA